MQLNPNISCVQLSGKIRSNKGVTTLQIGTRILFMMNKSAAVPSSRVIQAASSLSPTPFYRVFCVFVLVFFVYVCLCMYLRNQTKPTGITMRSYWRTISRSRRIFTLGPSTQRSRTNTVPPKTLRRTCMGSASTHQGMCRCG